MARIALAALAVLLLGTAATAQARVSADVAALQVALRAKGLYGGDVDGVRGPLTRAAVRRLQARARIAVDGVAGPRTRRALGRRGRPRLGSRAIVAPRARLGRRRAPVPARAPRVPERAGRRRVRPALVRGARPVPAVGRAGGGRRRRAGHAGGAAPAAAALAAAVPVAGRRGERRPLRPARGRLPHGHRLPGAARHACRGGGPRVRRVGRLGPRRLRPAGDRAPPARDDELVRAPVADRGAARDLPGRRRADRPRRLVGALDRPAPALRAARCAAPPSIR